MDKLNNDENGQARPINTNFEEIFYQSPIGIFFYDKNGILTNANDSALYIARIPKLDDVLGTNLFDNPKIASKKKELHEKGLIKFQDSLDLIKIKKLNIYNPLEPEIIDIDWTVSVTDSGYLIQIQDITDSKKDEEALKESKERYHEFFTNPIVGLGLCKVVVDEKGEPIDYIYLEVNDTFEEFTGLKREEIINKGVKEVLPEDADNLIGIFGPVGLTRKRIKVEVPILTLGRIYDVSSYSPCDKHFIAIFTDITERKKTEEALKSNQELFKKTFDSVSFAVSIVRVSDNQIVDINEAYLRMVEYQKEEVVGHTAKELQVFLNYEEREKIARLVHDGSQVRNQEIDVRTKSGKILRALFSVDLINFDNQPHFLGSLINITDRKKAEEKTKMILGSIAESYFEFDNKWRYVDVNDKSQEIWGLKKDELIGKVAWELFPQLIGSKQYKEFYKAKKENTHVRFETKSLITGEWFETNAYPHPEGLSVYCHNINDRKKAEELNQKLLENEQQLTEELQVTNEELMNHGDKLLQINKTLKESEERFRSIIENIQDGYMRTDKEGNIILVSPSAAHMYRFNSTQEMMGTTTHSYFKNSEDRNLAIKKLEKYGKYSDYEVEARRKDGKFFWVSQNAQNYYDDQGKYQGRETIVRDITVRKRIEAALKKSERSLETAQHIAHIGSWEWNIKTGNITWSNELYSIYNLDPNTYTPTLSSFEDYVHPDDKECVNQHVDQLLSEDKPHNFDFRIILDDGSIRVLNTLAEVTKFDKNEEPEIIIGINQDITERKKIELKLNENLQKLAQSNKELEQFAYITSHDLREPLRMITSFLQLLEKRYKDQLDQDANEFIGFAVNGAKRLDTMTKDLLKYSQITHKKRDIFPINFEHVLEHASTNLKVQIEENNAIITHDPLPTIKGNEELKIQLFQNIIGNAIKYRSQKTPKIHISAIKEKNHYIFGIKDNGIGMSSKHLAKIFTIFQRLHTHDEYEGTGIGLAIAQKIVHQQGGQIWVESELGKGSTFYFTLPETQ